MLPSKLHLRGVDSLHTDDIKAYVKTHFGPVDKVEWIDDTSANLVFSSETTAHDAMKSLCTAEISDPTALAIGETLAAKPMADKPEVSLQVRFALESDKKQAGAALRSRYYLLHPEHDPEERRRKNQEHRSRYRDRDRDDRRNGHRAARDLMQRSPRFEASMYDDAPASEDRRSDDGNGVRSSPGDNHGKELFAGRRISTRGRSASPTRDRDGDVDLFDDRIRSTDNRASARKIKGRLANRNDSKELFPTKKLSGRGHLDDLEEAIGSAQLREEDLPKVVALTGNTGNPSGAPDMFNIKGQSAQRTGAGGFMIKGSASAKELFPDKLGGTNAGKELFDSNRSKRRQKAEDLFS